jgi:hypothetical protein
VAFLFLHRTLAQPEKAAQQCRTLKRDRYVERDRRQIVMWYKDLRPNAGATIYFEKRFWRRVAQREIQRGIFNARFYYCSSL